ncbi:hypothetical protein OpiT1DRAFT_05423 [Opitutaceae bacterium TAV1]|nr:hypothetical protein OpiT1DRAFT_05423 [Opitutaceae bacterium TAV1]
MHNKFIPKFLRFIHWLMPVRLHADGGEGGGGGGSGDGAGGGGGGGGGGDGQQQAALSSDLRVFVNDKGELQKGWSKAWGGNEAWESKYTSISSLVGAHKNLEVLLGRDRVAVPNENATPEEWNAFYSKVGRPEKPEGYEIKRPDGIPDTIWSDDRAKAFATEAHKMGLTQKQVAGLIAWQLGDTQTSVQAIEQQQAAKLDADQKALKAEWGANYDKNLQAAKHAAVTVGGDALFTDPVLANHPGFVRVMAKVGAMISEAGGGDGAAGARGVSGQFNGDPKAEIAKIEGDPKDPYYDRSHPQHEARVAYVRSLYERAHPQT